MATKTRITLAGKTLGLLLAAGVPAIAFAETRDGSMYIGAGAGASMMSPSTGSTQYSVADKRDTGAHVYIGQSFTARLSAELAVSHLGSVSFTPAGEIEYRVGALSGLFYPFDRGGLAPFGRIGVGKLDNSGNIPYRQLNDAHVLVGAGLDYNVGNGIAGRAEIISFDRDAQYANLSLRYQFGSRSSALSVDMPAPVTEPMTDGKETGEADLALLTLPPELPVLYFDFDSVSLNADALVSLKDLSDRLIENPALAVTLVGHTDQSGPDLYNELLAKNRVVEVARYLVDRGVAIDQIQAYAKGEESPLGEAVDDYASNRRVEIYNSAELL